MHCLAIAGLAYKYPPLPLLRLTSSSSGIGMLSYAPPDRRWKPTAEAAPAPAPPSCPRCDSPNTKFCYYNNYSLSQPRYFCKGCRRYWTKGGSLRNVPVGGGCRKSRRGKSVRLPAPPDAARRSPPSIGRRPDLMLNDEYTTAADDDNDTAVHRPAAAIDLEVLYAKYLNRPDPSGPTPAAAATPEIAAATTSSESSCGQIPQQFPAQQLPWECQSAVTHPPSMEEAIAMSQINDMLCSFSVDSSSSLALPPAPASEPEDNQASFFGVPKDSISIHQEEFESFPVPTTCMQQHQQGLIAEDEWSSWDYSTLEAFYRC